MNNKFQKTYLQLSFILLIALIFRTYFYIGHIFSDDAYYSYLSYTLLNGNFANDYLGYPVFLLRINHYVVTSFSFLIFGINEFATTVFPFLYSLLHIILIYKFALLITEKKEIAFLSGFLLAIFPTDVLFASINFVDSPNALLINFGLYFLYKAYKEEKNLYYYLSGISFAISIQFKEALYYIIILLAILYFYLILKKKFRLKLMIPMIFVIVDLLIEGLIYYKINGNFFYRFEILQENYQYAFYNFFPYSVNKNYIDTQFFQTFLQQVFILSPKNIFLRRFYLFIPILALIQSVIYIKKKNNLLLVYWFIGLSFLMITFTTSIIEYRPLELSRSWYVYPLIIPAVILSSILLSRLKGYFRFTVLTLFVVFSVIMCSNYELYFNIGYKNLFKKIIHKNEKEVIYSDFQTKYSIDLLREYAKANKTKRLLSNEFDIAKIKKGEWVVLIPKKIQELKMNGHSFPNFNFLENNSFKNIYKFGDINIFEKK